MGAYDKINNSQAKAIRKLTDYHILTQGRQLDIVRIHSERTVWGEDLETVIDTLETTCVLDFPAGEMPLLRLRDETGTSAKASSSATYFYDILPTDAYFKWEDKIEVGDIFFFTAPDENGNLIPVIFEVLDQVGDFTSELIYRKHTAAPITSYRDLDEEVVAAIQNACKGL